MMGRQHRQANAALSLMAVTYLMTRQGYPFETLLAIPVSVYTSTFPDIDQIESCPKEWRIPKKIIKWLLILIAGVSIFCIIFYGYKFAKDTSYELALNDLKFITISFAVLVSYALIYAYSKSKYGAFLTQHRGFTHTPIIPLILHLAYTSLSNIETDVTLLVYGIMISKIILLGCLIGVLGHFFMDGLCERGGPFGWPIIKNKDIHWGHARTSDKNAKDGTHISSKIYTYITMVVAILITIFLIMTYT